MDATGLLQLQTAYINGRDIIGIQQGKPFLLEPVFRTVIAEEGTFSVWLYQTVTAAVFFFCFQQDRDAVLFILFADKVSLNTGSDWRK